MEKDKRLMEASRWERLTESCSDGQGHAQFSSIQLLSKSLIEFSVDGRGCVPSLLFTWGQTMVEVMKIMVTSFKKSHARTTALSAPNPAAGHHWPLPTHASAGDFWILPGKSGSVSLERKL